MATKQVGSLEIEDEPTENEVVTICVVQVLKWIGYAGYDRSALAD